MARRASQGVATLIAVATCAAAIAEATYWWSQEPLDPRVWLVCLVHGLVLVTAAIGSALGWVLQLKGPLWSRTVGLVLVAGAASVVLMWTAFLPADFWR
jgi:hypothetical protein